MLERILVAMLSNGHILLRSSGYKTTAVTAGPSHQSPVPRIQFTPDLLPADLTGTQSIASQTASFIPAKGHLANIILADETTAPGQGSERLLEAMQERQVTIGDQTFPVPDPFLVLATQNPIEQEGTYPLPEAQLDRFMLKIRIDYPDKAEERKILDRMAVTHATFDIQPVIALEEILQVRAVIDQIYMDEKIRDYIVDVVCATRRPEQYGLNLKNLIQYGASPRASIYLARRQKRWPLFRPRICDPAGCQVHRHGCPASSGHYHVRGGGRG